MKVVRLPSSSCTTLALWLLFTCLEVLSVVAQRSTNSYSPFKPPALPLAVRSPYFNGWCPQNDNTNVDPMKFWPVNEASSNPTSPLLFSFSSSIRIFSQAATDVNEGWYAAVQVDGVTYNVWGSPTPLALERTSMGQQVEFTPTRTTVITWAGPMEVNITVWSPVEVSRFYCVITFRLLSSLRSLALDRQLPLFRGLQGELLFFLINLLNTDLQPHVPLLLLTLLDSSRAMLFDNLSQAFILELGCAPWMALLIESVFTQIGMQAGSRPLSFHIK